MSLKKNTTSLHNMCLRQVAKILLQSWQDSYYTNHPLYCDQIKRSVGVLIPFTIYNKIFELMIDIHGRVIQHLPDSHSINVPTITALINTMIVPNLHKLNLNCLRYMGSVKDEEIKYLEHLLITELPSLNNLVELSLQTSGTEFTLPTCNDEMLVIIGHYCQNLKSLDVSNNHTVTDEGINCLIPTVHHKGCPLLNRIFLFECSVTNTGVTTILEHLKELKFLGYKETGQCLLILNTLVSSGPFRTLQLAHVNNLGIISRTCKDVHLLRCDKDMVDAICNFCPKLSELKVRVCDLDLSHIEKINSVTKLELLYSLVVPSAPGSNTIQYLNNNGSQLISLSFVCALFSTKFLKVICEQCPNLKCLSIRSHQFTCDQDLVISDNKRSCLTNLEVFSFNINCSVYYECRIPSNVIHYVLHKSNSLKELVLAMKNSCFDDTYIHDLFRSVDTSKLKHILILVPDKYARDTSLNLSITSVNRLIRICPQLEKLGNLLVWDVTREEVEELRGQLKISNCALVLVYKIMWFSHSARSV